jgi:CubicO group peptidase (beta-lactamase class C family)
MKKTLSFLIIIIPFVYLNAQNTTPPGFQWKTSTPAEQGFDESKLASIDTCIQRAYPNFYSFMIVRNDHIVYEKYYQGRTAKDITPMFSVAKSIVSTAIGMALTEGRIASLDQTVQTYLPEVFASIADTARRAITLRDCLTLTGGLEPIDRDFAAAGASPNQLQYILTRPFEGTRGVTFAYNSGLPYLLSNVVSKATGMNVDAYAKKIMFDAMGITQYAWTPDPAGIPQNLNLTPRDLGKFGLLFLHNGNWFGRQLIPAAWVKEAASKHVQADSINGYGYCWWINTVHDRTHGSDIPTFSARGARNQRLVIIPSLNMIVVITANAALSAVDKSEPETLIPRFVFPAMKE